jgi:rare lipoprotein A
VTDVLTGKSVVVRINDRGPFHPGRVIDLSYTAAAKLGYAGRGSTEVLVERVFPAGMSDLPQLATADAGGPASLPPPARQAAPAAAPAQATAPASTAASSASPAPALEQPPTAVASAAGSSAVADGAPGGGAPGAAAAAAAPSLSARASALGQGLSLQLGAFRDATHASRLLEQARAALHGFESFLHVEVDGGLSRVRLGPFRSAEQQNAAASAVERVLHMKPGLIGP